MGSSNYHSEYDVQGEQKRESIEESYKRKKPIRKKYGDDAVLEADIELTPLKVAKEKGWKTTEKGRKKFKSMVLKLNAMEAIRKKVKKQEKKRKKKK